MALVFPLLTPQLFTALTYRWGLTLVGVLAFLMAPTPFVRRTPVRRHTAYLSIALFSSFDTGAVLLWFEDSSS
jgi:bacteriorhodopsin